jgi:acrylyl-CoA reductase (NADPH)
MSLRALVLNQGADRKVSGAVETLPVDRLPAGDVTVAVDYSTLNYKDGLVLTSGGGLVKTWPHVGGIDFSGTVEASDNAAFKPGDKVVLNGWRVGELHWGGYATKARVKGDWLVKLPATISTKRAMAIGTAGYTSMLCVMALERHGLTPDRGPAVVTGAAGGVGSVAVTLLAKAGWNVIASTGRPEEADYLKGLGAAEIIARSELSGPVRPLGKERWAAGIDSVGSTTLANMLSMTRYGGAIAACGLAGGMDLPATVAPFILRNVALLGVESTMAPKPLRLETWRRLASELDHDKLAAMTSTIALEEVVEAGREIVQGKVRGRVVVEVDR